MAIPATFIQAYKNANPKAKPQDIQNVYNTLLRVNPSIANMDPKMLGAAMHQAMVAHLSQGKPAASGRGYADGGGVNGAAGTGNPMNVDTGDENDDTTDQPAAPADQPTPTVNPSDANLNVPVPPSPNPYAGTGYTQADLMQQFDPNQVKQAYDTTALQNAYAQQQALAQQNIQARGIAGSLSGGANAVGQANQAAIFNAADAQNMLQTIELQSTLLGWNVKEQAALQAAATQGLAAGKTTTEIAQGVQKTFADFADNVTKSLNTQQQQRLDYRNSPETQTAKALLAAQIQSLPPATVKALQPILSDPNVTARQLLPAMATYVPAAYKAFSDAAGIGSTNATAAKTTQETANLGVQGKAYSQQQGLPPPVVTQPGTPNVSDGTSAPQQTPQFNFSPGTNLAVMRATIAKNAPDSLPAFDAKYPNAAQQGEPTPTPAPAAPQPSAPPANTNFAGRVPAPGPTVTGQKGTTAPASAPDFTPITNALVQPNSTDPTYIANADPKTLTPLQQLYRGRMEATDPDMINEYDRQIAETTKTPYIKEPVQQITLPSAGGNFSNEVNPAFSGLTANTAKNIADKSQSVDTFNMGGKPAAQNAFLLAANNSGYNKVPNWSPDINANAKNLDINVNRLNAEAQRLGQVVGGPGNAGSQIASGALGGLSPLLGAAAGVFSALNTTQAITSKSPPEVIKEYAVATQVAAQRQAALLNFEKAYSTTHNGDTTGFVNSPDYKLVMNAQPFINPKTGDVVLPLTSTQQQSYMKRDANGQPTYGPLSSYSFKTPPASANVYQ